MMRRYRAWLRAGKVSFANDTVLGDWKRPVSTSVLCWNSKGITTKENRYDCGYSGLWLLAGLKKKNFPRVSRFRSSSGLLVRIETRKESRKISNVLLCRMLINFSTSVLDENIIN